MRLKCSRIFLLVGLTACNVFAVNAWICGSSGNWSVAANWSSGHVPDGREEAAIGCVDPVTVTLDTTESWVQVYSNRMRVLGSSTLKIMPGGSLTGPGWLRVGEKEVPGAAKINQTGGLLRLVAGGKDPTRLVLGDSQDAGVGTSGTYTMSGGTLMHIVGNIASSEGSIIVGDRGGTGIFQVIGTDPKIDMARLYVGGNSDVIGARGSTGTLEFDLKANGVSPIVLSTANTGDNTVVKVIIDSYGELSKANLVVNFIEAPGNPYAPIVLVDNQGTSAVSGVFDTINGFAPPGGVTEDTEVLLGDFYYKVTYLYDADEDDMDNDIALTFSGQLQDQVDLHNDGQIDLYDFAVLASYWMQTCAPPDYCGGADLDRNGYVDLQDLIYLFRYWLESLP